MMAMSRSRLASRLWVMIPRKLLALKILDVALRCECHFSPSEEGISLDSSRARLASSPTAKIPSPRLCRRVSTHGSANPSAQNVHLRESSVSSGTLHSERRELARPAPAVAVQSTPKSLTTLKALNRVPSPTHLHIVRKVRLLDGLNELGRKLGQRCALPPTLDTSLCHMGNCSPAANHAKASTNSSRTSAPSLPQALRRR